MMRMTEVHVLCSGDQDSLQLLLDQRAQIEQAKGILMALHRIGPQAAFDMLARESQQSNRKLREVARDHVERASNQV